MLGKQANGTQEKTCQFEIKKISCEVSEHIKALGCFTKQKELRKNKISLVKPSKMSLQNGQTADILHGFINDKI